MPRSLTSRVRSSTRPYPWDEDEIEGLTVEDVDGDGRILQMRMADANGLWKEHPEIASIPLGRPIVIAGLQRTGTTLLHRLLALRLLQVQI